MKHLPSLLLTPAAALLIGACERQSYSDTRPFTHHGEHGSHSETKADGHAPAKAAESKPAGAEAEVKPAGETKPAGS